MIELSRVVAVVIELVLTPTALITSPALEPRDTLEGAFVADAILRAHLVVHECTVLRSHVLVGSSMRARRVVYIAESERWIRSMANFVVQAYLGRLCNEDRARDDKAEDGCDGR